MPLATSFSLWSIGIVWSYNLASKSFVSGCISSKLILRWSIISNCASSCSRSLIGARVCKSVYSTWMASITLPFSRSSMYFYSKSKYSIILVCSYLINSLFYYIISFLLLLLASATRINVATIIGISSKLPARTESLNWVTWHCSIRTLEASSSSWATWL